MITQAVRRTLSTGVAVLLLGACAADAPTGRYFMPVSTMAGSTGMVIGTVHYAPDNSPVDGFQRLEIRLHNVTPGAQPVNSHDYALTAMIDIQRGSGMFSGQLPAGRYGVNAIATPAKTVMYGSAESAALIREFEVVAGAVIDVGDLRVNDHSAGLLSEPVTVSSND